MARPSKNAEKDVGYVYIICKECEKLFPWLDEKCEMLDLPIDYKYYCPECVSKGFKNHIQLTAKQKRLDKNIIAYLRENNIKDKMIQREFTKRVKNFNGKCLSYKNILKQAEEVVSYKREK